MDDPFLEPVGVHAHASRQTTDLSFWHTYAQEVGVRCAELAKAAEWHPTEIDLGGGFAVPRDPTGRQPLPEGVLAPSPREYLHALARGLEAGLDQGGLSPEGITLQVEPGRAIYGNAGIHLTRVLNVKQQEDPQPRTWIETDTSETFLGDTIIERNSWRVVLADDPERADQFLAAVTGRSCGFDLLVAPQEQPKVATGELLAFLDTGAYQDVTANNFNVMPRPASVLVTGSAHRLIRERETLDAILARDVWPDSRN
jgi:diaminopimelate decarboxylase